MSPYVCHRYIHNDDPNFDMGDVVLAILNTPEHSREEHRRFMAVLFDASITDFIDYSNGLLLIDKMDKLDFKAYLNHKHTPVACGRTGYLALQALERKTLNTVANEGWLAALKSTSQAFANRDPIEEALQLFDKCQDPS